ncbi:MAG: electron transporter RnfC, partial [Mucinivorans sp.]
CTQVCPMGLEPYLLFKISKATLWDRLEAERITDCIECGCCAYTCPASLPLLDYIRLGKTQTMSIIRSRK